MPSAHAGMPRAVPEPEIRGEAVVPTRHGSLRMIAFTLGADPAEHVALVSGEVRGRIVLARVHSECMTSEVFGSLKCDCAEQLDRALEAIVARGPGVVVYLRQEGRGIGLGNKLRAYALQSLGADTVDANRLLGLPDDARRYDAAASVLGFLGIEGVRLLTNNPAKVDALERLGVRVCERVPIVIAPTETNAGYLHAKRARMDHLLPRELLASDG